MTMLDPKGLEAAREQPGTNHEAIIRAYIDAIMPMKVSGLVERLRQYEGRSWETTHCYNGVRDEAAISIENLSIGLATVWRNKLEAEDALSSERAAHAETKRELADHPRATSIVDAQETANVSDKPSADHVPHVGNMVEPSALEGQLSGNAGELIEKMAEAIRGDTSSNDTPWATLSEDRKIGWRGDAERALAVVKEYLTARRPSEQAVSDEIELDAAKSAAIELLLTADDVWTDYGSGFRIHFSFPPNSDMRVVERIISARALKAAMEAGRQALASKGGER